MAIDRAVMQFFTKYVKEADVKTKLLPHQQRVVDRITKEDQPGLLVVHGLGSGKTLTSIAAQDALKMPATAIVPAALAENYEKERTKHLGEGERQPVDLQTLQYIARHGTAKENPLLILDEAHRIREAGKSRNAIKATKSEKRILMTGSPFYNRPSDVAPLLNIAAGQTVLPNDERTFNSRFLSEREVSPGFVDRVFKGVQPGIVQGVSPKGRGELSSAFNKWVDYHPGSTEGFPQVNYKDVNVGMTPEQMQIYRGLEDDAPWHIRAKVRAGLPTSKQDVEKINAFLNAVRQVTNSTRPFQKENNTPHEPKIDLAFSNLKKMLDSNPAAKAVVYSNYLGSGIAPYKERLQKANIPFGEFTGEMNKSTRNDLVKQYNDGKLRALLLSSAGGEGLDLKGTRLMQILEPHWNMEKIKQVEGRGARYLSHAHLPEEERNMQVERYIAKLKPTGMLERMGLSKPGFSADEYLAQRSQEKEDLIKQFKQVMSGAQQQYDAQHSKRK